MFGKTRITGHLSPKSVKPGQAAISAKMAADLQPERMQAPEEKAVKRADPFAELEKNAEELLSMPEAVGEIEDFSKPDAVASVIDGKTAEAEEAETAEVDILPAFDQDAVQDPPVSASKAIVAEQGAVLDQASAAEPAADVPETHIIVDVADNTSKSSDTVAVAEISDEVQAKPELADNQSPVSEPEYDTGLDVAHAAPEQEASPEPAPILFHLEIMTPTDTVEYDTEDPAIEPIKASLPFPQVADEKPRMTGSYISNDLIINGNLSTHGDLTIDGTVHGDIQATKAIIGESATIYGEVAGEDIIIHGKIEGRVRGTKVYMNASAHVVGDIIHGMISVESGAHFEGSVTRKANPLE